MIAVPWRMRIFSEVQPPIAVTIKSVSLKQSGSRSADRLPDCFRETDLIVTAIGGCTSLKILILHGTAIKELPEGD